MLLCPDSHQVLVIAKIHLDNLIVLSSDPYSILFFLLSIENQKMNIYTKYYNIL